MSLYRGIRGCGKENTTMNNDKRLILFERTERERERKEGMRNDNASFFTFAQLWKRSSDIVRRIPGATVNKGHFFAETGEVRECRP